jgi:hypothetical protein
MRRREFITFLGGLAARGARAAARPGAPHRRADAHPLDIPATVLARADEVIE